MCEGGCRAARRVFVSPLRIGATSESQVRVALEISKVTRSAVSRRIVPFNVPFVAKEIQFGSHDRVLGEAANTREAVRDIVFPELRNQVL